MKTAKHKAQNLRFGAVTTALQVRPIISLSFSEVLCVYKQLNTPGKLNPSAAASAVSLIADQGGSQRCRERRGRGVLGRLVHSHKNSRFQLRPIVGTKTHQSGGGEEKRNRAAQNARRMKGAASLKFHLSCFLLIILSISLSFAPLSKAAISKEYFSLLKSFCFHQQQQQQEHH